jgi:hypothetical protein
MSRACHGARARLLGAAGAIDAADQPHVAGCAACAGLAAALRADAELLARWLPVPAPDLPIPVRGSRALPPLALAEGRTLPAAWLLVPAAAAAAVLLVALLRLGPDAAAPRVAGVQVEPLDGGDWGDVLAVAADRQASGPAGPLVDRVLDQVGRRPVANGEGAETGGR